MKHVNLLILCLLSLCLNAQEINTSAILQYIKAFEYIQSDSINKNQNIKVSDEIVDLDRFYFKPHIKSDSLLTLVLDSLNKYYWFDSFNSSILRCGFKEINNKINFEKIVFFSSIEKNTLRADLFINEPRVKNYDHFIKSNKNIVYAYLFFLDENKNITNVYRDIIHYEPF